MAERPDLEYVVPILHQALVGRCITSVRVKKPVVLRVAVPGDVENLLPGLSFESVARHGHFVIFSLANAQTTRPALSLVVSPMLAGRFAVSEHATKDPADLAVAIRFDNSELRYRDDVQMGKVYVVPKDAWHLVPGMADIGVDVLNKRLFTRTAFRTIARGRRDQAKVFLMDKQALDSMGNAYADEVLFAAGIHPKTMVSRLSDQDIDRLHDAIVHVLIDARATLGKRKPAMDVKLRDFLKVRGRHGEPCPRCGTKIRSAGVHGHDANFCPTCQPATRKSGIVDWRGPPK